MSYPAPNEPHYPPSPSATSPGPPAPPPAPPKKRSTGKVLLIIAAVLVLCCGGGIAIFVSQLRGDDRVNLTGAEKSVVFEVTGAQAADITYGIGTDQSQDLGVTVPWRKELKSKDSVLITVLTAQNKGAGEIACKITVDGKVVKENKSQGEFAVVTCSNG